MRCGAIAVLNQLPFLGRERLGAAQRQLFLNLVKALGLSPDELRIQEESFRWPFAEAMLMDAGAEAARQSLRAYVDEQAGDKPFRALLVLGEQLAPFVLPSGGIEEAEPGRLLRLDGIPWPVLLSRSLDEMLSLPPLKRQVWRDLAALSALSADG